MAAREDGGDDDEVKSVDLPEEEVDDDDKDVEVRDFFDEAPDGDAAEPTVEEQHLFLDQAKRHLFDEVREQLVRTPLLVNVQPLGRWSALHHASESRNADAVQLLLEMRADRQARTNDGRTPLQVAKSEDVRVLLAEVVDLPEDQAAAQISIKWRWDVLKVPRGPLPLLSSSLAWSKTYGSFAKAADSLVAFRLSDASRSVLCRIQVAAGVEELVFRNPEAAARGLRELGASNALRHPASSGSPSQSRSSSSSSIRPSSFKRLSASVASGASVGQAESSFKRLGASGVSVGQAEGLPMELPAQPAPVFEDLEAVDAKCLPIVYPPGRPRGGAEPPFEAILGSGAFGTVWRGKDKVSGTIFAIKNVRKVGSSASMRECDIASLICDFPHPCVVELLSVEDFPQYYSVVMEFCGGRDLLAKVSRQRDQTGSGRNYVAPRLWRPWLGQVLLGLEHLHLNVGVLLRDLKPDNVILNEQQHAKLTDFGFSRQGLQASKGMTFGHPVGTPGYVSPEVLKGQKHDCKTDLYSYGVLVWLLLAGGVSSEEEPQPPIGEMQHQQHYRALFDDWKKLVEAASLRHTSSASFDDDARDLVLKLVTDSPAKRLDHAHIRAHPLLEPLALPRRLEGPHAVRTWLARFPPLDAASEPPEKDDPAFGLFNRLQAEARGEV